MALSSDLPSPLTFTLPAGGIVTEMFRSPSITIITKKLLGLNIPSYVLGQEEPHVSRSFSCVFGGSDEVVVIAWRQRA